MTDDVFPDDGDDFTAEEPTALGYLQARRQQVRDKLEISLEVPRYDPPIVVKYKPIPMAEIDAVNKRYVREKGGAVLANATLLAKACVAICEYDPDGEPDEDGQVPLVSVDPDDRDGVLTFGPRLAKILGLSGAKKATDTVRGLYATEGDIASTADKLAEFSGYTVSQVESEFAGN